MIYSTLLLAFTGFVSAQTQNYSLSGPISIIPDSVDISERQDWCTAQMNSCPEICGPLLAYPNNCSAITLEYTCNCTSGFQPNISNYDQTIPSFVCAQWIADCVVSNQGSPVGQAGCHSLICGQLNASSGYPKSNAIGDVQPAASVTAMPSESSSSADATTTASTTGTATTAAVSSASKSATSTAAAVIYVANQYGTGILATSFLAIFGLFL